MPMTASEVTRVADGEERASYRVGADAGEAALEGRRLDLLGALRDRRSIGVFQTLGVGPGWRCLDVGSGGGSLARWLAATVGPAGHVLSTDVDLRFQGSSEGNLEVRQHDVVKDALPAGAFDLVHARAVLQLLEQREAVLDKLVRSTKPGGWIVIGDPDFGPFESQPLPAAFRALYEAMKAAAIRRHGYDPYWGRKLLSAFQRRGLLEIDCEGWSPLMRGGTESAEYLVLGYERAAPELVRAGLVDQATVDAGLAAARQPDFLAMGALSVIAHGRRPL